MTVINAGMIAEQRRIQTQTIIASDQGEDRVAIEINTGKAPDRQSAASPILKAEGAIYSDGLPRITHLDGYNMDMVPAGHMVLLTNADRPGRIGLVGKMFGDANVNIAEMVIGRKPAPDGAGQIAMMILKVDEAPPADLLAKLRRAEGILNIALVNLPKL